jgi:hypothetical protein
MRFALKAILMAGLVFGGLVATTKADFDVQLQSGNLSNSGTIAGNGSTSLDVGVFSVTAVHTDTSSYGADVLTITSSGAGTLFIKASDLVNFTALGTLAAGQYYELTTAVSNTSSVHTAGFSQQYADTSALEYLPSAASIGLPSAINLTAGGYNPGSDYSLLSAVPGFSPGLAGTIITFSGAGSVKFITEVSVVPEPASILTGLVGLPFLAGLVGYGRRRAKNTAALAV